MRFNLRRGGYATGRKLLCAIATFVAIVSATPSITFPLNSQVPPVARVEEAFSFTLSSSTFTSDTPIRYSLKNGPAWLSLNGRKRKLSGIPPEDAGDVVEMEIEARDSTGSVTMSSRLVVSSNAAPEVAVPLSQQIDNFADYSAPNLLLFYPSTTFNFSFDPATFRTGRKAGLNKYAVTLDNAPLPSWIHFDEATMTFSGETPGSGSLISPTEQFGIQLIASKVPGFGEVSVPFFFVVQNHKLAWRDSFRDIKIEAGSLINFRELVQKLELDGKSVVMSDLESITSDAPKWLKFDAATFALFGIVPKDSSSFNVTITAIDKFGDVASVMVSIDVSSGVFANEAIQPLNATIGQAFSFNVSSVFAGSVPVDILVSVVPVTSWLSYDPEIFILAGDVPDSATATSITVTLSGKTNSSLSQRATDSKSFTINILPEFPEGSISTSAAATYGAAPSSPSEITLTDIAQLADSSNGITRGQTAALVVVPSVALIFAALLLYWCWRRRWQRQFIEKAGFMPMKKNISRPQLLNPSALLTPSSSKRGMHPALRSHCPGSKDDTSIYTRLESDRESILVPRTRCSISNMTYDYLQRPLHRSNFDGYITKDLPSLPSTYTQHTSYKAGAARTKDKKSRKSKWRYQPYRMFNNQSELNGRDLIRPEVRHKHKCGICRITKPLKTQNYVGSIDRLPSQPYSGMPTGSNVSDLSNYSANTQIIYYQNRRDRDTLAHGWPGGKSVDSEKTWQTVHTSSQKSLGRSRPNSAMTAETENTDILYEYLQLPQLPPAAIVAACSSGANIRKNYPGRRNTIRLVSQSSNYLPERLPSSNTMQSTSSSVQRCITRHGGSSSFSSGSARTNSRAEKPRSAEIIEEYPFSDEMDRLSIAERDETDSSCWWPRSP